MLTVLQPARLSISTLCAPLTIRLAWTLGEEGQSHFLGPLVGELLQPVVIDDEQVVDEDHLLQRPLRAHPLGLGDDLIHRTLVAALPGCRFDSRRG